MFANKIIDCLLIVVNILFTTICTSAQKTEIRGFVDVTTGFQKDKLSFSLGEQDLFITSQLSDCFSFLSETVFRFTPNTATEFSASVERIVIKYNYSGNHNILIGKHHTPLNYWNDMFHHGRVFFPTIYRPLLFEENIIPLHTTGINLQGQNLGDLKFGYDLMLGNGIGAPEVLDNDKRKSVTAAIHIKPSDPLRLGMSFYNDVISEGASTHFGITDWKIKQSLFTGSVAYFGEKFEVLAEGTLGFNKTDTTGSQNTVASYLYAGYKITEKVTPYLRFDQLHVQDGEIYYDKNNMTSFIAGIRLNLNYLAAVKLEFQRMKTEIEGKTNKISIQVAIGF